MVEFKRKFEGVWIPKEVWLDDSLSIQEKVMLVEINSLDNDEGCFASNDYFSKFFGFGKARASQIISGLENKNLITIDYIYKGKEVDKRIIKISYLGIKYFKQGIKYIKGEYNNINIINDINNTDFNSKKLKQENINNLNTDLVKKEKRISKKKQRELEQQQNDIAINNLIDKFTDNPDIQELLEQYVEVRKQRGILTSAQFMIILDDLKTYCGDDLIHQEMCIRKAIAGGWSQIVFIDNFKGKAKTSYSSFDNTAGHFTGNEKITDEQFNQMSFEEQKAYANKMALADMTKKQREFFNQYCLARDENGNLLEF